MPDLAERAAWERRIAHALASLQGAQLERLLEALGDPPDAANVPLALWEEIGQENRAALEPQLVGVAAAGAAGLARGLGGRVAEGAVRIPARRGAVITFEWGLVDARAAAWARRYTFDLVRGVNRTTQRILGRSLRRFYEGQWTLGELRQTLTPAFGATRAKMIAETETTRASVQGELALVAEVERRGLELVAVFNTSNDEIVCPICTPLNQRRQGDGWFDPPPLHVRCRCWINHVPAFLLDPAETFAEVAL